MNEEQWNAIRKVATDTAIGLKRAQGYTGGLVYPNEEMFVMLRMLFERIEVIDRRLGSSGIGE
jgi:hypothetical protein